MAASADIKARFAKALRARREGLHLTQEEAAHRCRLNVRYWRALEAGKSVPGLDTLDRILAGIEWSWHDLADEIEAAPAGPAAPAKFHRALDTGYASGSAYERGLLGALLDTINKKGRR